MSKKIVRKSEYLNAVAKLAKNGCSLYSPYQEEGVKWLLKHERRYSGGMLCDEMGLGKTIQIIGLILGSQLKTTLLVLPASLLIQWKEQIEKFAGSFVEAKIYHGSNRTLEINKMKKQVIITSYNLIINDNVKLKTIEWDRIILDECHYIRNPKSRIFQSISKIPALKKWGITGTPIQNYVADIETLFKFLGYSKDFIKINLEKLISNHILRRTKDDVKQYNKILELPERTVNNIRIRIKSKERGLYNSIKDLDVCYLERILREKQSAILPQMFIDSISRKTKTEPKVWKHENSKLNFIVKKIKEQCRLKKRILVFTTFNSELDYLQNKFKDTPYKFNYINGSVSIDERNKIIADDSIDILAIQIVCGGTGLNLQKYNVAFFTSPPWNPSLEEQAIARLHRIGQTQQVEIYRVLVHNTIDCYIDSIQRRKNFIISNYISS